MAKTLMNYISMLMAAALMTHVQTVHAFEIRFGGSTKEIPQWVANPAADNADYIYGVGESDTLAKAVQSALNSISGKLATVVSSNISAQRTLNEGKLSARFSEEVKSKTFATKLSKYEVVQSASQDEHFYVSVRMSRPAFVSDTTARLKILDERLSHQILLASEASKFQHYLALNEVKSDMVEATSLVLLLQAASPTFDGEKYLSTYRAHQATADELPFQMSFRVEVGPGMASVGEMVARLIGSEKLSVSVANSGKAEAVISVTGSLQNKIIFSEYSTQLRVKIQVTDDSGRKIHTEEHVVAGSSLSSFESSKITATNLLETELQNESVLVMLGLQKTTHD